MHWQAAPHAEQKLVRCVVGRIWDVALDLRPDSPSFMQWHAEELSAERGNALFLPRGVAHGFLTLTPGAVVEYLIDAHHIADAACGARWNDPAFGIDWPAVPAVMSDRDRDWPDFPHG
jgi:dTDP-4-dehydrorhamnose 3,5-epimerase